MGEGDRPWTYSWGFTDPMECEGKMSAHPGVHFITVQGFELCHAATPWAPPTAAQFGIIGPYWARGWIIEDNHIHDIHRYNRFSGAEIAGIKLHAVIDCLIAHNRIEGADRGIWLDWQAQGTRVHANLMADNDLQDLFIEVSHGPSVVDHNVLLSAESVLNVAQGTCFAHNILAGTVKQLGVPNRFTPDHMAHPTAVVGLITILGGDDRWCNNLFLTDPQLIDTGGPATGGPAAANSDFVGIDAPWAGHGTSIYDGFPVDYAQWNTAQTPDD